MPTFRYHAKEGTRDIKGTIEAQTKNEAVEKIHEMGYLPVNVEPASPDTRDTQPAEQAPPVRLSSGKVRSKDITLFTWQLASLIKSGVPILRSLQIISQQSENRSFKKIVEDIQSAVQDGKPLSETLAHYPMFFSSFYVAMVRSGESSGMLQEILFRIAAHRQKQEEILSHVRMALAYPIFISVVGAGTILFMFIFVMPKLIKTFTTLGQELPLPTKILLAISSGLEHGWPILLIGIAAIVLVIKQRAKKRVKSRAFSQFQLRLPLAGEFIRKNELARLCRTLEMLIKSGIPILKALEVATPILDNEIIREELVKSYHDLKEGGSLGRSLEHSKLFPVFMTNLVVIGEESGRLSETLGEIADSYIRDTEEAIKVMTSLLEPIIILVMGLIVGFIVVSMLLPIFEINAAVK